MLVALLQPSPGARRCGLLGALARASANRTSVWGARLQNQITLHPSSISQPLTWPPCPARSAETFELFDDVMLLASGMVSRHSHFCPSSLPRLSTAQHLPPAVCQPLLCPRLPLSGASPRRLHTH